MSIPQRSKLLHSLRCWKDKAIARRQENEALKKRIIELTQSRDAWRLNAQIQQTTVAELQAERGSQKNAAHHAIAIVSKPSKPSSRSSFERLQVFGLSPKVAPFSRRSWRFRSKAPRIRPSCGG